MAVAEGDEIRVVYRRVHPLKTGLELCGLILVLILVLIVIRRIRKLRSRDGRGKKPVRVKKKNSSVEPAKRREAPKEKPVPEVKTVVRFCPNCGTACEPGGRFCKECGTDLSRSEKQYMKVLSPSRIRGGEILNLRICSSKITEYVL